LREQVALSGLEKSHDLLLQVGDAMALPTGRSASPEM
jgi:hypothetical protein